MVSARIRRVSVVERMPLPASRRAEALTRTGRMNSSEITVSRKMHPNTATIWEASLSLSMRSVRGYSSS